MSRILRRPMFKMGGSTNEGIMTGLVDRKGYSNGDIVERAGELIPGFEELLTEYTPKTRLPLGAVGASLVSGTPIKDALISGYTDFTTKDDARRAGIKTGAAKLGIQTAISQEQLRMQQLMKDSRIPLQKRVAYVKQIMGFQTDKEALEYINTSVGDVSKQTDETRIGNKLRTMPVENRNKAEYLAFLEPYIPAAKRSNMYILSDKNQFPKKPIQGKTYFDVNKGILYEFVGGTPNDINSYVDVTEKYNKENYSFK